MTARAIRRWIGAAAVLAALAWWAVHVPYRPERILEAVPAEAELLWVADAPGARAGSVAANPLVEAVLAVAGIEGLDEDDLAALRDPDHWTASFLDDETAAAVLPAGLVSTRPAVIVSAWAGFDARRLRWFLPFFPDETFRRRGSYEGVRLTGVDLGLEPPLAATLALDGGVAVLCISDNPRAMLPVLDALFGRTASIAERFDGLAERAAALRESAPDRLWWFPAGGPAAALFLTEWNEGAVRGRLAVGEPHDVLETPGSAERPARRTEEAGAQPMASAGADAARLSATLRRLGQGEAAALWTDFAERIGASRVSAGMYDGELAGRVKGFRVPSLVAAADVDDAREAQAAVMDVIDRLNAAHHLGLIPHGRSFADAEIVTVMGAASGLYGSLPESECAAYTLYDGTLYVASNPLVLEKLLAGDGSFPGAEGWPEGDWLTMDPERAVKAARLGLSVYSLKLWADNSSDSDRKRAVVQKIRAGMEPLSRFGEASIRIDRWAAPAVVDLNLVVRDGGEGE